MSGTVNERPILFSGAMVCAILGGRKTQTRRVVIHRRKQPPTWATYVNHLKQMNMQHDWVDSQLFQWSEEQAPGEPLKPLRRWPSGPVHVKRGYAPEMDYAIPCPHGRPGDRLWVRETWSKWDNGSRQVVFSADRATHEVDFANGDPIGIFPEVFNHLRDGVSVGWKPSIHMPRWASRLSLEITKIRAERVQDISESDAIAEGMDVCECIRCCAGEHPGDCKECAGWASNERERECGHCEGTGQCPVCHGRPETARHVFQQRFKSWSGLEWDSNPWVWVIEFQRVQTSA